MGQKDNSNFLYFSKNRYQKEVEKELIPFGGYKPLLLVQKKEKFKYFVGTDIAWDIKHGIETFVYMVTYLENGIMLIANSQIINNKVENVYESPYFDYVKKLSEYYNAAIFVSSQK